MGYRLDGGILCRCPENIPYVDVTHLERVKKYKYKQATFNNISFIIKYNMLKIIYRNQNYDISDISKVSNMFSKLL